MSQSDDWRAGARTEQFLRAKLCRISLFITRFKCIISVDERSAECYADGRICIQFAWLLRTLVGKGLAYRVLLYRIAVYCVVPLTLFVLVMTGRAHHQRDGYRRWHVHLHHRVLPPTTYPPICMRCGQGVLKVSCIIRSTDRKYAPTPSPELSIINSH